MTAKEARELIVAFVMELGYNSMNQAFFLPENFEEAMQVLCRTAAKEENE